MKQSYIFGGQTGLTYDQIQKQRDIANELLRANMSTPQNVGEGLSAIGRALAAKAIDKRTSRADEANRKAYEARRGEVFGMLGGQGGAQPSYGGPAPNMAGPTPITFTPETPNPAGLDPSIISAVDRVAPNQPQQMDASAVGTRLLGDLMRDFNLTQEQAAGVVGNLAHETGGFKHMQEISPVVPGSRGGFGFAQWTGPRRKAFEAWSAENGLDPTSYEANYGFLQHELKNTPEGAVLGPLSQAQTADQAAQVFSNQFLRPGVPAMGSRQQFAQKFADPQVLMALAEVQGDPYASESDKAIASLLMQQTVQAMDPMRQMEMEKARLELDQMRQPEAPKPLEVGGVLLDPVTFEPIFDSRQEQGPAAVVNVGGEGQGIDFGDPPKDMVWLRDEAGNVLTEPDPGGRGVRPVAVPIGGSQIAEDRQSAQEKGDRTKEQTRLKLGTTLENLNLNIQDIEDGGLPVTGAIGDLRRTWLGRAVTGDGAMDFGNRTNQITDSAALAEVQNMRDNSPTGGAVGSLTDDERRAIGNAVTSLNNSTSAEEYARAAKNFRKLALDLAYGEGKWELDENGQPRIAGSGNGTTDADGWTTINGVKIRVKQ